MNIDANQFSRLIIKTVGMVFIFFELIPLVINLTLFLGANNNVEHDVEWIYILFPPIGAILIGAFLWLYPSRVSNVVLSSIDEDQAQLFEVILVCFSGLVLAIIGFSDLTYDLSRLLFLLEEETRLELFSRASYIPGFVSNILFLLFGLIIFFKGRKIVAFVSRYRDE